MPTLKIQPWPPDRDADAVVGDIFSGRFIHLPPVAAIHTFVQEHVHAAFAPHNPVVAHRALDFAEFTKRAARARELLAAGERKQIRDLIGHTRFAIENVYWDKLLLRVVPPLSFYSQVGEYQHTPPHRDTWGVNIHSQINWWSPIFDTAADRTIRFYPEYWQKALSNTTATWSLKEFLAAKKRTTAGQKADYPSMPQAQEIVDASGACPAVIKAGEWLLFSAAHLHDSVPNTSSLTRFSLEFRTVDRDHILKDWKAPNVDNAANKAMPAIFSNVTSGESLRDWWGAKAK